MKAVLAFVWAVSFSVVLSICFVGAYSEVSKFEVNILKEPIEVDILSVEVPDRIHLGNVSIGDSGEEVRVWVNNTGNVAISVTPGLVNPGDQYFRYLYFRGQKTKTVNGSTINVPFEIIGDFSFNISKPGTSGFNDEDFYVFLNLSDYSGTLASDLLGYEADVKFVVTAQ